MLRQLFVGESRVVLTPDSALQLQKLGHSCVVESGAGVLGGFSDEAYRAAGVEVVPSAAALWETADVIAKVRPPEPRALAAESASQRPRRSEAKHRGASTWISFTRRAWGPLCAGMTRRVKVPRRSSHFRRSG